MDTDGNLCCFLSATATTAAETDTSSVGTLVFLFVVFVILGAYFGGTESAISAMNKLRIKAKADDGNRRAKNAVFVSNNFDRALTTLLIGNNITHIAAASVATVIASRLFGTSDRVTVLCTVLTTLIVFLFSEMIPKSVANDRSETISLLTAGSLRVLMKLFSPLAAFFSMISSLFTKIAMRFIRHTEEPSITEDELYDIIDTIEEEGVLNEEQGDLFKSALDFSETCAKDIMTMRDDIVAVDASLSGAEILSFVCNSQHTRLPVYEGSLDNIIGILVIRTYIKEYLNNPKVKLKSLLLPSFHVSPDAQINDLLTEMRQHRFYLAVVADEDGKTEGLVTIEDFLEELVGEIWDEDDVVDTNFVKLGGNRFRVNTHLTLDEISEKLGVPCPEPRDGGRPLLSLMIAHYGHVPEEDESILYHGYEITAETIENGRVDTAVIRILSEDELAENKRTEETAGGDRA